MTIRDVGLYDAAVRISEFWYFIPGVVASSFFPAIVSARETNAALYRSRLKYLFVFITVSAIALSVIIALVAKPLILSLFGNEFRESIPVVYVYVWSGLGIALMAIIERFLIAENYGKILLVTSFIGMTINIALNLLLIPIYGITGAAIATLAAYTLSPLVVFIFKAPRETASLLIRKERQV